jgi:hypothetical protein
MFCRKMKNYGSGSKYRTLDLILSLFGDIYSRCHNFSFSGKAELKTKRLGKVNKSNQGLDNKTFRTNIILF